MKQYDTYIFDLDGTLLDTLGDLAASVNHALRSNGLPERTTEHVRQSVGNGVERLIERVVPGGRDCPQYEAVLATFRNHYLEHSMDTTRPYPGIVATLEALRQRGRRVAVVSNKFSAATEHLCRLYFGQLVEAAIGQSDTIRCKPCPDGVNEAMRRLNASPESTVYIGDSDVDVATAAASNLPCISVLWGFRDRHFLEAHGATTFINSPEELLAE